MSHPISEITRFMSGHGLHEMYPFSNIDVFLHYNRRAHKK